MSHFFYFAHNLLQDCVSKRAAFAFLNFLNKRKKKNNMFFLQTKDFISSFPPSPFSLLMETYAVGQSWHPDIETSLRIACEGEKSPPLLLPGPLHKPSCFLELSESQPVWNGDAVSQQGNVLLLKTSLRASSVQHLQLPWSTVSVD